MWKRETSVKPSSAPSPPLANVAPPLAKAPPTETPRVESVVMDLGKSVVIKGEVSASEDLTLCGQMDGRITLPDHTLTVGPRADIRAEIVAKAVLVLGAVTGNVTAGEKVDIGATGSVVGDIVAPRFGMVDGGQLHGKVRST
jgi:cytoskeletal protein CcmA (bactofilin family)